MRIEFRDEHTVLRFEDDDEQSALCLFLKEMRRKKGISTRQMAAILGHRSHTSYLELENGTRSPTLRTLESIVQALSPGATVTIKIAA